MEGEEGGTLRRGSQGNGRSEVMRGSSGMEAECAKENKQGGMPRRE